MQKQLRVLLVVLILDGIIFGSTFVIMRGSPIKSEAVHNVQDVRMAVPNVQAAMQDRAERDTKASPSVAFTFDDGPHSRYTLQLLDGLKQRGVRATFFLMGESIAGNENLVRRMDAEGHLIGNHGYRHVQMTKEGLDAVCDSVNKTQERIRSITGKEPEYLRPPYGDWNEQLECRLEVTPVLWTVDSQDWKLRNTQAIVRRVAGQIRDGDIVLFHDIFPTSVEAALQLIDQLKKEGFAFVTIDELLID